MKDPATERAIMRIIGRLGISGKFESKDRWRWDEFGVIVPLPGLPEHALRVAYDDIDDSPFRFLHLIGGGESDWRDQDPTWVWDDAVWSSCPGNVRGSSLQYCFEQFSIRLEELEHIAFLRANRASRYEVLLREGEPWCHTT